MKRFAAILLSAAMMTSLWGCSWLDKILPPPAQTEPTAPSAPTDSMVKPEETVFSVTDLTETDTLGQVAVTITTPKFTLANADAAEVINQYYRLLAGKVRDYAEGDVAAMDAPYKVTAYYRVSYHSAGALSIGWTVETTTDTEAPNFSSLSAGNFDIKTGKLLTFSAIFGANAEKVRGLYLDAIRAEIAAQLKDDAYYYENYTALVESEFSGERFYLADDGIVVFYPRDALGTHTEALLTWETLKPYLAMAL